MATDVDDMMQRFVATSAGEDLERYCEGGFHPVHIGDRIHDRYQIFHKLGFGSFSTVWLAKDLKLARYVSLKIVAADQTPNSSEIRLLYHLELKRKPSISLGRAPPGSEFVLQVLDQFQIHGPNGTHLCIVGELLGPSIVEVMGYLNKGRLPLDVARKVASQVAQGVAFLHACGIVHGGTLLLSK